MRRQLRNVSAWSRIQVVPKDAVLQELQPACDNHGRELDSHQKQWYRLASVVLLLLGLMKAQLVDQRPLLALLEVV